MSSSSSPARWPHAVLFDFDGVLCNSEPLHFLAFHGVLKAEKIELTEAEYYEEMIGFDDKGAFRHIFARRDRELDPKTFLRVMTAKGEVMKDLIQRRKFKRLDGVEEFVRSLWRHCPLAICSGALREEIEAMLEGLSLRDCFHVIIAAEDVEVGKPDPRGYVMCMDTISEKYAKRHLKPADCLIVEDAPSVIREVKKIGFPTLAVTTSYPPEKLADADHVVASLSPEEVRSKVPELKAILQ